MTNAYDKIYLERARITLGCMLDHAVNDMQLELSSFYGLFLATGLAEDFGKGDARVIAGNSGAELAGKVLYRAGIRKGPVTAAFRQGKTREFWAGWTLAWYQWSRGFSFSRIESFLPITAVREMYEPYHEMDIRQFADSADEMYRKSMPETTLARLRKYAALSQSVLAKRSGVPVRTIQQYEQRQKDISKAGAEQLERLGRVLCCRVEELV